MSLPWDFRPSVRLAAAQIFFAAVGAAGEVRAVIQTAPALFVFCFLQIAVHLLLILGAGRMAGFSRKELLLASNANVGGGRCLAAYAEAALAMLAQDLT